MATSRVRNVRANRKTSGVTSTKPKTKTKSKNVTPTVDWSVFFESTSGRNAVIEFARGKSFTAFSKSVYGDAKREVRKLKTVPIDLARKRAQSALDREFAYTWR